jgi:Putative transposase, YhgA-like
LKKHDRSYRLLFSQPRMVEDLIRRFVAEPWIEKLDFTTLERVNGSHVAENLQSRDGDVVWRLRVRGDPSTCVYVLVEFQSEVQRFMALRQSVYVGLFCQQLVKQGELAPGGLLPLVLSIVIYNGKVDWRAPRELAELIQVVDGSEVYAPRLRYLLIAMEKCKPADLQGSNLVALLIRLERSRTRSSLRQIIRDLVAALPGSDEGGLRRAFVVWLQRVLLPAKGEEDIPELIDLEDFRTMLIERVEEWSREIEARAEKKWLEQGHRELLLRQLEVRFGPIDDRTRARVLAARSASLLKWAERILTAERLADVFGR